MIKGLVIFDHCCLYSAHAGDATFFLRDIISLKHLFLYFSGLKPSLKKSEIGGIGALKGVQVAACYLRCIDLSNDTLKILGTHFSYNEKLKEEKTCYNTLTGIQRVLKIWKKRNLTLKENCYF